MFLRPAFLRTFQSYTRICVRALHDDGYVTVREFYKDKNVLITGSTGFVGQGLVEKLLRSCPDIGRIYIPIRTTKKGYTDQRYRAFLNNTVFDTLRETNSNFGDKLVPLPASLEEPNLGLSESTLDKLTNEINVIYHVAALIKFNPPLREAISSNVVASTNVFRFGKKCKHLAAYVHVSTLYVHLDLESVDEKVYPTDWDHNRLIELMNSKSDKEIKRYERDIVGGTSGTYFATKKASEYMTQLENGKAPVGIFRPGKVSPSWKEPVPGWVTRNASYIPLMMQIEKGELRHHLGVHHYREEVVPVDLCANSLITMAWYLGTQPMAKHHCKEPLVVHVPNSGVNDITIQDFVSIINECFKEEGRPQSVTLYSSRFQILLRGGIKTMYYTIRDILDRKPPITLLVYIFGLFTKGTHSIQVKQNPACRNNNNLMKIEQCLRESDKKEFSSNIANVNWKEYIRTWLNILKAKREEMERKAK